MNIDKDMSILIVDDMQPVRQALANILRSYGFSNMVYASNGKIGLDALNGKQIDLVLLDWNMPKMSGIAFLREMRAMDDYKEVPVIMVTAENSADRVHEAINAGVTGYLLKPFSPNDIKVRLSEILGVDLVDDDEDDGPEMYFPS